VHNKVTLKRGEGEGEKGKLKNSHYEDKCSRNRAESIGRGKGGKSQITRKSKGTFSRRIPGGEGIGGQYLETWVPSDKEE